MERSASRGRTCTPSTFTIWLGALALSIAGTVGALTVALIPGEQPNYLRLPLLVAPMGLDALVGAMLTVWRSR